MKKFHSNPTNQQPHSQSSHLLRNKSASVSLGANQTHARGDVLLQNRIYLTSRCFASRPFHGRGSFPDFEQNWVQAKIFFSRNLDKQLCSFNMFIKTVQSGWDFHASVSIWTRSVAQKCPQRVEAFPQLNGWSVLQCCSLPFIE
ncbi:hypothetical protein T06_5648 [Trichinella sp. T6]|nr:hypothetical protein T06_5648 [Trichinella sp. T6]